MSPNTKHRHSIRLPGCDYSLPGLYFITICTYQRECLFGEIKNDGDLRYCELSEIGKTVNNCWFEIPQHFPNVILDEFIIMPNHIHGIIQITDQPAVGVENFQPLQSMPTNSFQHAIPKSLASIIRGFKIGVTKWCKQNGHEYFAWQRNYFEHIIRNNTALQKIREYIVNNPLKWFDDTDNPRNWKK